MLGTRIKVGVVAAVVAAGSALVAAPAHAGACHPDPLGPDVSGEEKVCQTVLHVLCAAGYKLGGGCPIE